jgi:hypothetical protein
VIGGGAAGFFGAIQLAERTSALRIVILEKSTKVLAKVKISGGGRCNVTHACYNAFQLADHYPRGEKALKNLFKEFQASDMIRWLEDKGVALKTEDDGRIFPTTDSSDTIISTFLQETRRHDIEILLGHSVESILHEAGNLRIMCNATKEISAKKILIAVGGNPKSEFYQWISRLGHSIHPPIPSLFTFNDPKKTMTDLMGVSVREAEVKIATTKLSRSGPLLITHWGLSGPAVIKLSAWAAQELYRRHYEFTALVNWIGATSENDTRRFLLENKEQRANQKVYNYPLKNLPARLWEKLCIISEIDRQRVWRELSNRQLNKLMECLIRFPFEIQGKTTFKDEFVTCGGIPLSEVDLKTMASKIVPGIHFAGEVLDIDGETGGFNFQAAWTTSFIAARAMASAFGKG